MSAQFASVNVRQVVIVLIGTDPAKGAVMDTTIVQGVSDVSPVCRHCSVELAASTTWEALHIKVSSIANKADDWGGG